MNWKNKELIKSSLCKGHIRYQDDSGKWTVDQFDSNGDWYGTFRLNETHYKCIAAGPSPLLALDRTLRKVVWEFDSLKEYFKDIEETHEL